MIATTAYSMPDEKDESKTYQLRISKTLLTKATRLAGLKGMSLAGYIKHLLLREIEKEGL